MAVLVRLFGGKTYYVVQFLNVGFFVGAAFYLGKCWQNLWGEESFARNYLGFLLFLPMSLYITFVYGTIPGLFFAALGMYMISVYWKERRLWKLLAGVIAVGAACGLKQNYLIVGIALFLILGADMLEQYFAVKNKRYGAKSLLGLLFILLILIKGQSGVTTLAEQITGQTVTKGIPSAAWIAMGLREGELGPGWWENYYNVNLYKNNSYDTEETAIQAKEEIRKRIQEFTDSPSYALDFFGRKTASQWSEPSFQSLWIQQNRVAETEIGRKLNYRMTSGIGRDVLLPLFNIGQTIFLFGILIFLIKRWRTITLKQLLFFVIFLGGFFFHLFWEAKGQYTVFYMYLLIPYGMEGYRSMAKRGTAENRKEKNIESLLE